jgi:hypothetical protein
MLAHCCGLDEDVGDLRFEWELKGSAAEMNSVYDDFITTEKQKARSRQKLSH